MVKAKPRIYADFHNADSQGRLRLNCIGTMEDLAQQQVKLHPGLALTLYADDADDQGRLDELEVDGVVGFSEEEHCWVATIDWEAIKHASERQSTSANGPAISPDSSPVSRGKDTAPVPTSRTVSVDRMLDEFADDASPPRKGNPPPPG